MRFASALVLATALQVPFGVAANPAEAPQPVALKALAERLSEEWPVPSRDIRMTMTWRLEDGSELLHCRIVNTSSHALELNESELPWNAPHLMAVTMLSAEGSVVFSNTNVPVIQPIPWRPRTLSPGEALEGDQYFAAFYGAAVRKDLLVVWSQQVVLYMGQHPSGVGLPVSGITFVPKHEERD